MSIIDFRFCELRVSFGSLMDPDPGPDLFADEHDGRLFELLGPAGSEQVVERAAISYTAMRSGVNEGVSTFDIWDAHSQDMLWIFESVPHKNDEDGFDCFERNFGDILVVNSIAASADCTDQLYEIARRLLDHLMRHTQATGILYLWSKASDSTEIRRALTDRGFVSVAKGDECLLFAWDTVARVPSLG